MEQLMIANGGLQFVPQIAAPQIVYLDFDGELTDYNGEVLTVDNVNVSASGYDQKSISSIINQLNDIYSGDLFFTDIKPEGGEYSTVYIGKSNFLSEYASIQGISETIDVGNKIKNDNAFVFLDSSSDIGYTTHVIAHEIGHIVYGDTHSGQQHNPYNQTTAYQYYSVVGNINSKNDVSVKAENTGIKSLPLVIDPALKEYCYVMQLLADMTKLYGEYYDLVCKQQYYQQIYAYENLAYKNNNPGANAVVKNWQVAGGTRQILTNGATASLCYILGVQSVSFGGSANQCAAMNGGSIQLWGGTATNNYISGRNASLKIMRDDGYASNTVIDGGTMQIPLFGGSALNTVVKNGGKIDIVYNLGAHAYLFDTYIDSGCTLAVRHLFDEINGQTTTTHQIRLRGTTYLAGEMIFSSYTQPGKTDVDFSTLSFRRVGYRVENCGDFIFGADSRTPYDNVMVSNMNSIWNASDYNFATGQYVKGSFYVAVASDMQSGQYRLAGNARDYYENHSIYILDVDTDTEYFHTYNSQLKLGHKTFSVQLNSSDELCLMVKDVEAEPEPKITDLEITDLTISSTDITAGTPLTLKFSLKNSGNYEAATSVVGIYDGSQLLYRINAIALPIRTSQLFTHVVDTGKMTGGTHNLRIIADIDNDVNESNEKNNETNISVQVRTKAQQADLVIDDFTVSTSSITTKENVTLNFTVKNVGTLSAPNSIVGIYDGSNYLGSINVNALEAGASKSYTYTVSADKLTKGEHNLIVEADKDNLIAEQDETNNRKSITVQVTAPSNVDLVPYKFADYDDVIVVSTKTGTHKDASTITTEDKIYIDWGVINQGEDSIDDDFYTALYLDDKFVTKWVTGELWSNYCIYIHDYELGTLSAGEHTLKIVTDYSNAVAETSESNNAYTKTFTVLPSQKFGVEIYSSSILTSQGDQLNNALISGANNYMYIFSGGVASNTQIEYGSAIVYSGGVANNTTVNSSGTMIISSGGVANDTTVNSGGRKYISSGGVASNTQISAYGRAIVYSGGVANSTTVNSGGYMYIYSGGIHKGTLTMKSSANVSAHTGSVIDFTVAERTVEDDCLINDLSLITGTPTYTITVSADQSFGTYKLAQGAENFAGTISIGDGTVDYGEITVNGEKVVYGKNSYILKEKDGDLTLTISAKDISAPQNLQGDSNGLSWDAIPGVESYIVEYSTDNFATVMAFETTSNKLDSIALPSGTYQWRVKVLDSETTSNGENITSQQVVTEPQEFVSNADGNTDVFFANANGKWGSGYAAQHTGILNGWSGTSEQVTLAGKNKLTDIFEGSSDANILVMTDDANGDALFMDDIYTALPGTVAEQQARIAKIDEIRAGAGDDIVDMTSQQFAYIGDGVKIYGGLGNDTIWANNGNNTLFGDAGNDRIVGGSANDLIVGGIGNDSMHGGGGNDIFTFGENFGKDTVEQLADGKVTLWFESGSASNWNASTLTYSDGNNSVKVSGVTADKITLKFGDDQSALYDKLAANGSFDDAASEKIFEDKNKGFLA